MTTEKTYDADGTLTATHVKPNTYTISYSRKVPRDGGFGAGEEASLFVQVDVDTADAQEAIDAKVAAAFARAKGHVLSQLGVSFEVNGDGVVVGAEQPAPAKARGAAKKAGGAAKRTGGGSRTASSGADKGAAWEALLEDPDAFYDNRGKKASGQYKPNAADFKGARGPHKDVSLWLDNAPEHVKEALDARDDFDGSEEPF
jgi:hypothetical protein